MAPLNDSFTIYFAGELFSDKHLVGNAIMAEAIDRLSDGRYRCILPQCLEQRDCTGESIRNSDIYELVRCDLGLFNFEGLELDSGTVVEFMIAKFLDIPSVIVRSDFRSGGDNAQYPWNLMAAYYPRTEVITRDGMGEFKKAMSEGPPTKMPGKGVVAAAVISIEDLARQVIAAFDRVIKQKPRMPVETREAVYNWIRSMPGDSFAKLLSQDEIGKLLERKTAANLL